MREKIAQFLSEHLTKNSLSLLVILLGGIVGKMWFDDYKENQTHQFDFIVRQSVKENTADSIQNAKIDELSFKYDVFRMEFDTLKNYQTPELLRRLNDINRASNIFYKYKPQPIREQPVSYASPLIEIEPKYDQTLTLINNIEEKLQPTISDKVKKNSSLKGL